MKKYFLSLIILSTLIVTIGSSVTHAATVAPVVVSAPQVDTTAPVVSQTDTLPQEGAWITDPTVTTIGKNAARSGKLLDWALRDYKWASDSAYINNPLVPLWLSIQRIVYALFLFVVLVTAFILIITRGRSLSAKRFLPRFFLVVLLVTFSFSLVQFLYQIIDIFQGFFLKNPAGSIISQRDLLYIGFDYESFKGLRVFGQAYDESAFISLLLVKLTAFTYYVMVILLIFRKIILWFLIIVSPVFPILLLFYPLRNTAKIWIGEFFRWLLYAPLFAIFLSGLVRLWHSGLPLIFNFTGANDPTKTVYPTAINILVGGPGMNIGLNNSVNLPDTFALYLVALLMLWVVIILPFILLQIFLDYMMAANYQNNPFVKQVFTMLNNRPITPFSPLPPGTPPPATTGLARRVPFAKHFEMPKTTGLAKQIPTSATRTITRPSLVTRNNQTEISRLTNLSIPTMRDIARFETTRLSKDVMSQREIERTKQTLVNIANPTSVTSSTERDRFKMIRDRLVTEGQKGNSVATTILNAATTYNSYSSQSSISSISQQTQQLVQHLSQPTTIISKRDQQKIVEVKQELGKAAKEGNQFATTILNSVNSYTTNQVTQLSQLLQGLAHPEKSTSTQEKEKYTSLREKIISASNSGNPLASLITQSMEGSTSTEQVKKIQDQLLEANAQGNPLASELLKTVSSTDKTTERDMEKLHQTLQEASKNGDPLATLLLKTLLSEQKPQTVPISAVAKLKSGTLPQVNRIQQVSLEDYEAVKKMWKDNYKNVEVPAGQQSRKDWITQDIATIEETVSLLSSANQADVEKGMQQVSDILPFLLIGGFSQTEIIAYLKAKMEAGKNVLEDDTSQTEEDDTLLATRKATTTEASHMAASAEISQDVPVGTSSNASVTNNYTTITNNEMKETIVKEQPVSQAAGIEKQLLERAQLSLPTLKDIAQFETKSTKSDTSEVSKIKNILIQIAHPEKLVSSTEKERFTKLREEIVKESKNNNQLAGMILAALDHVESLPEELSPLEAVQFSQTLQQILTPQTLNKAQASVYQEANKELVMKTRQSDPLAVEVTNESTKLQLEQFDVAKDFLTKLSNPTHLTTASEQMHYNKLVERIAQASEDGNPTASLILKTVREPITKDSVTNLIVALTTNVKSGDSLASYIQESIRSLSDESKTSVSQLYQQLRLEKDKNNPLALSLLKLFSRELKTAQPGIKQVSLPTKNRLQQVTVDDYETVKQLWLDNYQTSEAPQGMSRDEWIGKEGQDISDTINLLSSPDPKQVEMGMDRVADILPFLLLGGFSQQEIVGYLKAKLEAGKTVLASSKSTEDTLVLKKTVTSSASNVSAQMVSATNSTEGSSSQIGTSVPTLRDIAKFEVDAGPSSPLLAANPRQTESAKEDEATSFLVTLQSVLDPSLAESTAQVDFRTAREELVKARQSSDPLATMVMQLSDKVTKEETQSVMKFMQLLDNPSVTANDKEREAYTILKQRLEKDKETNVTASKLLTLAHGDITPVSANKVRTALLESRAVGNQLASQILQQYITLPQTTRTEVSSIYQQIVKEQVSPFAKLVIKLVNDRRAKIKSGRSSLNVGLPKQNKTQKVNLDDYESVKKMFYERFLHGDVPKTLAGGLQSRQQWITEEKNDVSQEINLLTSDDNHNIEIGMQSISSIMPFILLGGFSQDEIVQYLRAKKEAAGMALEALSSISDTQVFAPVQTSGKQNVAAQAEELPVEDKK